MNKISIYSIKGIISLETVFNTKPDLSNICEWSKKCWIRIEYNNKLGKKVQTSHWIGLDDKSKGHYVYWPDKWTVFVEHGCHIP